MARYLTLRVAQAFLTVLLVLVAVFVTARIAGDPVTLMSGFDSSPEEQQQMRDELGLSDPLIGQFAGYVGDVVTGDFGTSFRSGRPAMDEVLDRVPSTLLLALAALVVAVAVSIPAGIIAAVRRGTRIDALARLVALAGQATPNFWLGLMLITFVSVRLGWFPTGGRSGLASFVLPSITMGTFVAASLMRLTRSAMLDVLDRDYITLARAKGLAERRVVFHHAFRNALIPVVTILGLRIGVLLAGSVIVETVFAWPGVGRLIIQSINVSDFPVVQAAVLLTATCVVLANLLTDIVYMFIDPRVRYG